MSIKIIRMNTNIFLLLIQFSVIGEAGAHAKCHKVTGRATPYAPMFEHSVSALLKYISHIVFEPDNFR